LTAVSPNTLERSTDNVLSTSHTGFTRLPRYLEHLPSAAGVGAGQPCPHESLRGFPDIQRLHVPGPRRPLRPTALGAQPHVPVLMVHDDSAPLQPCVVGELPYREPSALQFGAVGAGCRTTGCHRCLPGGAVRSHRKDHGERRRPTRVTVFLT